MVLRVRELRREQGISQCVLAERVGVAQGYISDVELAKCTPSLDVFFRIARALGCSLDELAGDSFGEGKDESQRVEEKGWIDTGEAGRKGWRRSGNRVQD